MENAPMDKRGRSRIIILTVLIIVVSSSFFAWATFSSNGSMIDSFVLIAIGVAIVGIAAAMIMRRWNSRKEGFPLEDELAKASRIHAAACAFTGGMYFLVALMFYNILNDDNSRLPEISADHTIALIVIANAALFLCSWLYFSKKGVPT